MATTSRPQGYQPRAPRGSTFETRAWQFTRWSGILLLPLAFIHLAYMHIINSVYDINYHWVIENRWFYTGWRWYDAFLLVFAGLHGFNGLRYVINDYVTHPGWNRRLKIASVILMIITLVVGAAALILAPTLPNPEIPREEEARLILSLLM